MEKKYIAIVCGVAFFLGALVGYIPMSKTLQGSAPDLNYITAFSSSTVRSITTTPTLVSPTNTGRTYARFTNNSDTAIELNLGGNSYSTSSYSVRVNANGGIFEILPQYNYIGPVYASSSLANKALMFIEN